MKIAIFGTGIVGQTIAARLSELGHDITVGTRDVTATLSRKTNDNYGNPPFAEWLKKNAGIKVNTYRESAASSELIFNCTSGQGSIEALEHARNQLGNKILVDVANPLDFSNGMPPTLSPSNTDSLGELIQRTFPETKVVKALNTMNCFLMVNPSLLKGDHNVFISGNDATAKDTVKKILLSFGWTDESIIDLGDITTSRGTEQLLPIWLRLYGILKTPMFNFRIVSNE